MKKKLLLDLLMGIVMFFIMNLSITGAQLHEILGITIFFVCILHIIINYKWVIAVTLNLFKKKMNTKSYIMWLVNIILLVLLTLNIVTGILISTYILPDISADNISAVSSWHHFFAYWLVVVLIIHVCMHWGIIRNAVRIKKDSFTEKLAISMIAIILVTTIMKSNNINKLTLPIYKEDNYREMPENHDRHEKADGQPKHMMKTSPRDNPAATDKPTVTQKPETDDTPTLEAFLSKLFCTGCGKHCPLTNPQCGRGEMQKNEAIEEYNQTYAANE